MNVISFESQDDVMWLSSLLCRLGHRWVLSIVDVDRICWVSNANDCCSNKAFFFEAVGWAILLWCTVEESLLGRICM